MSCKVFQHDPFLKQLALQPVAVMDPAQLTCPVDIHAGEDGHVGGMPCDK